MNHFAPKKPSFFNTLKKIPNALKKKQNILDTKKILTKEESSINNLKFIPNYKFNPNKNSSPLSGTNNTSIINQYSVITNTYNNKNNNNNNNNNIKVPQITKYKNSLSISKPTIVYTKSRKHKTQKKRYNRE